MSAQRAIPCVLMRGGTSKGAYFLADDLPRDPAPRDRVLLAVMGSPDARQIDGVGGADPLTSKVAVVSRSPRADADVDYLFAQVAVAEAVVDVSPTCGNVLAGVGPFAIEQGLVPASGDETVVRIHMVNTGGLVAATVRTPEGRVAYDGGARIDGVHGTAAPVMLDFLDVAGGTCGALLPTGRARDEIEGVAVTLIDNGMPVAVMRADALGRTGYESRDELNADAPLKARIEAIRLRAGPLMGLGDVTRKVVPKMSLVASPRAGGSISSRTFIPHDCHAAIGVLGAVSLATACLLEGSPAAEVAATPEGNPKLVSVEHPSGELSVELDVGMDGGIVEVRRSALLRTSRRLFEGRVLVPSAVWPSAAERRQ
ncbi:MAG TPA: 4-oxalomesaconate tautomerase [Thermoanaerobaculia bacterium]